MNPPDLPFFDMVMWYLKNIAIGMGFITLVIIASLVLAAIEQNSKDKKNGK